MIRFNFAVALRAFLGCILLGLALALPACHGGGMPTPGAGGTAGTPAWGMAGGGPMRQGLSAYAGPDTPEIAWEYAVDSVFVSGPVYLADGTLCIATRRVVLAFNENGEEAWRYYGDQNVFHYPYALPDGSVLVAFVDGTFARLEADGTPQWEIKVPGVTTLHATAFSREGNSYAYAETDEGRQLIALDPNGAVLWRQAAEDTAQLFKAQDGYLFGSTPDSDLVIYGTDGELLWQLPEAPYSSTEFIGSAPGGYAIALTSDSFDGGEFLRMFGPQGTPRWFYEITQGAPWVQQIVVDLAGNTYLRMLDFTLLVMTPLGRASFIHDSRYTPVGKDLEGYVYAVGEENGVGYLYELNSAGQPIQQWEFDGNVGLNPAFSVNQQLAITGTVSWEPQQELGVYSFGDGLLWSYRDGGSQIYKLVLDAAGNCYVNSDSIIVGLDKSGNRLQRTVLEQGIGESLALGPAGNLSFFDDAQRLRTMTPEGELLVDAVIDAEFDPYYLNYLGVGESGFYLASRAELFGLNPDGSSRYRFATRGVIQGGAAIGRDGTAFVRDDGDNNYAIAADGTELWRTESRGAIWRYPVVMPNGWVLFPGSRQGVLAVDGQGQAQWELSLSDGNINPAPAVAADGTVYAPLKYDPGGVPLGYPGGFSTGIAAPYPNADGSSSRVQSTAGRSAAATIALNGVDTSGLCALTAGGELRWFLPLDSNMATQPVVDSRGRVYVLDMAHLLHAISSEGEVLWSLEVPYISQSGDEFLAISPQNRIIVLQGGVVTAIGP